MSSKDNHVNRREFIATGSLVVAGMSVGTVPLSAALKGKTVPLALSVGYIGYSSNTNRKGGVSPFGTIDSAKSVLTGDPSLFSLGAQFAFPGMQRFSGETVSAMIDVMYQTDQGEKVPFFAFTHAEAKRFVGNSSPSGFMVPVPTQGTIDLVVKARRASSPESSAVVSFAVNTGDNALMLNRGVYLFALTDRSVEWKSMRLANGATPATITSGSRPLLVRNNDGHDVNFDYIVMTVDAAPSRRK